MKKTMLFIAGCFVVGSTIQCGNEYVTLSAKSKEAILFSALKGGLITVGSYAGLGYLFSGEIPKLQEHALAYGIAGGIGTLIMGYFRANYVPEAHYNYARDGLYVVASYQLIVDLLETSEQDIVPLIKDAYFKAKFPLYEGFRFLNRQYDLLDSYYASFAIVADSYRTDLKESSNDYMLIIQGFQAVIRGALKVLKEDAGFINECNAQTMIEMQHAQMVAAQAALIQATTPQTTYIVSH